MRALLDLVLPTACGGCGAPGTPWCPGCATALGEPVRVYPPCPAGVPVYALGAYRGPLRAAVLAFKERGRRDLAAPLGAALAAALPRLPTAGPGPPAAGSGLPAAGPGLPPAGPGLATAGPGLPTGGPMLPAAEPGPPGAAGWCLVPAPSRWTAAARRGGQHMDLLARHTAAALARTGVGAAVAPALRMAGGVRDSVGLDRAARQANLAGRVRLAAAGRPPPGVPIVLLDDVVTTGATVSACATVLLRAGGPVTAIVVLATATGHGLS